MYLIGGIMSGSASRIPNEVPKLHKVPSEVIGVIEDLESPFSVVDQRISGVFSGAVLPLAAQTENLLAEYGVPSETYQVWLQEPGDALLWGGPGSITNKCSEVVLNAMNQQFWNFDYASGGLKENQEFLFKCIDKADSYEKLAYMFNKLEYPIEPEVMLKAINRNPRIISWLREDSDFKKRALLEHPTILSACNRFDASKVEVLKEVQNIAKAGRNTLPALKEVLKSWGGDRDVVLAVVKVNGLALKFVDNEFKKDIGVARAAVDQNLGAQDFVHWSIYDKIGY